MKTNVDKSNSIQLFHNNSRVREPPLGVQFVTTYEWV